MSASTEILLEKIEFIKRAIDVARGSGQPTDDLEKELTECSKRLATCNETLEKKNVLRG